MKPRSLKQASIFALSGLGPAAVLSKDGASLSVKIPSLEEVDASGPIDPSFCGFAFEQASFVRYAQDDDGKPNVFSNNLIKAVTSRTGGTPIIRLGGTSPDYGRYLPGQKEPALPVAEQDNYQNIGSTTIGPSFWALTRNFPGAKYMVQVPLATTNVSETVAWAQSAVDGIGIENIHSIQPGNEADLYADNFRGEGGVELNPPEYQGTLTNETYVGNWTAYVDAILAAVDPLPQGRIFTAFDVAAHVGDTAHEDAYVFDVETCFNLGIDARGAIKDVSHHYYQRQAGTAGDLGSGLMNTSATHKHLDQFRRHAAWLERNRPGVPFVLNEVGNSLFRTNSYPFQARLGSALWQADFYLYAAAAAGVARVNYQQIMHAGYDLWQPVGSAGVGAQVFANFYSQPFVADFFGASGIHKTRAAKLDIAGGNNVPPNLAVYAAYEDGDEDGGGDDGKVRRIAITNLDYWNLTSSGYERPSVTLAFEVPRHVEAVTVYHLNSPLGAGAAADSITYGGSQWTYESLGEEVKGVRNDTEHITVKDGVVRVTVWSSEAVLVWL
ncbi:glycoside hydrolase family 79 protein [Daldinia bambusicola]|nr:glycoside hydrolase family 79 protein [Daldinia bambusicola]